MFTEMALRGKWFMGADAHMYLLIDDVLSKIGYIKKYDSEFVKQDKVRELNEFITQKGYKGSFVLGQYVLDSTVVLICKSLNTRKSNMYANFLIESIKNCLLIKPRIISALMGGSSTSPVQYNNQIMNFNHTYLLPDHSILYNIDLDINNQMVN